MASKKVCPNCQALVDEDAAFCDKCGTDVRSVVPQEIRQCPQCGAVLDQDAVFCASCGAKVVAATVAATAGETAAAHPATASAETVATPEAANAEVAAAGPEAEAVAETVAASAAGTAVANADVGGTFSHIVNNYLSFDGRLNRWPYFYRGFVYFFFTMLMLGACAFLIGIFHSNDNIVAFLIMLLVLLCVVFGLLSIVCGLSLAARRCHDMNHSAAMLLLLIVPIVDFLFMLFLLFVPGTAGPNQYGPDPTQQ
jgi:uncharacterized membrane protein YhaH (DUF805 family)/RNA polymerase subunit RPABC4/transcription elongation factor Spt4